MRLSRRRVLEFAAAGGAALAIAKPVLAASASSPLFRRASRELGRLGDAISSRDIIGLADYGVHSSEPRFHLLDMRNGKVSSFLVSHGRGSDPENSGWVQRFSNDLDSHATSEGAYCTSDYYTGKHGRSMRLVGLDPSNSNAESRAIVVHGAWYVAPSMLRGRGKLGRSEGCFAFSQIDVETVLGRLGPGRLLIAAKIWNRRS
jgi:L,D-transpeptidase catalytic domain